MEQQKQLHLIMEWDLQWFAKDGPGGEKTEPATAKKLREAREDGKVVKSKELTAMIKQSAREKNEIDVD